MALALKAAHFRKGSHLQKFNSALLDVRFSLRGGPQGTGALPTLSRSPSGFSAAFRRDHSA